MENRSLTPSHTAIPEQKSRLCMIKRFFLSSSFSHCQVHDRMKKSLSDVQIEYKWKSKHASRKLRRCICGKYNFVWEKFSNSHRNTTRSTSLGS